MRIQNGHDVGVDSLRMVGRRGHDRGGVRHIGRVCGGDRLPEAVVGCQHGHAIGQLVSLELDELLDERPAGTELFRSSRLDVMGGTGQYCGERHSLRDYD